MIYAVRNRIDRIVIHKNMSLDVITAIQVKSMQLFPTFPRSSPPSTLPNSYQDAVHWLPTASVSVSLLDDFMLNDNDYLEGEGLHLEWLLLRKLYGHQDIKRILYEMGVLFQPYDVSTQAMLLSMMFLSQLTDGALSHVQRAHVIRCQGWLNIMYGSTSTWQHLYQRAVAIMGMEGINGMHICFLLMCIRDHYPSLVSVRSTTADEEQTC